MNPDRHALHAIARIAAETRDKYREEASSSPDLAAGILSDFAGVCDNFHTLAVSMIAMNEAAEAPVQ